MGKEKITRCFSFIKDNDKKLNFNMREKLFNMILSITNLLDIKEIPDLIEEIFSEDQKKEVLAI